MPSVLNEMLPTKRKFLLGSVDGASTSLRTMIVPLVGGGLT